MKIALFTDTFFPQVNGVSLTLQRLVNHLKKRDIEVRVFAPETGESDFFEDHLHAFTSFPFFLYPECRIAIPNVKSMKQVMEAFQPDVIHVATPFNMGLCGLYFSKKMNIPMLATHHTHFDRYLEYYRLEFLSKWVWNYLRWFHAPCRMVLAPSAETKNRLLSYGFTQVGVWPRGVDTDLFTPAKRNETFRERYGIQEKFVCLYVGRIAPEKDLDILVEVIKSMPEPFRSEIHWLLVGEGPMLKPLQESDLPHTTFTGYLQGEALAEAYANADLFVFPSTTETFGNVVLESLASGIPAIGTRSGGVQEIIRHEKTGLLCTPRSAEEMQNAIIELIGKPERLEQMRQEARAYALTQSWEQILDLMIRHYERIQLSHNHSFSA